MDSKDTRTCVRRAAFAAAIVATLFLAALMFAAVASSVSSGADGYVASSGGSTEGAVSVAPPGGSVGPVSSSRSGGDFAYASGQASASSGISDGVLVSQAEVSLNGVSLLDGVVRASGIHLVARATASGDGVAGSTAGSFVSDLSVNGQAVDSGQGTVTIDGVGTLSILGGSSDGSGASASADVVGLRLSLSAPAGALPAGAVLVAGHASARADQDTWRSLVPSPTPSSSPTPSTEPSPSKSPSPSTSPSPRSSSHPRPKPSPTSGSAGASASPVASFDPAPMPLPVIMADAATRFPGAVFPVLGAYTYTNDWLAPRIGHLHQGIDIFAAMGTRLVAVQDGTVDTLNDGGLGGISLHVTNERGDYFYYAHLSGYAPGILEGMPVRAGDVIGYVGNTGDAVTTPPHLHFEIHPAGGPAINAFPFLEVWRAQALAWADVTQQEQPQGGNSDGADYWKLRSRELTQGSTEPLLVPLLTPLHPVRRHDGGGGTDPISGLPLVAISALGAAVIKRLQWAALLP